MGVVEEREMMRRMAVAAAAEAVRLVEKIVGPVSAAVVGSYARGDFNQWSDVDLLVVSPRFDPNPLNRFEQVVEVLKKFPSLEIIPLTLREFERQRRLKTPLAMEAIGRDVVLKDAFNILGRGTSSPEEA